MTAHDEAWKPALGSFELAPGSTYVWRFHLEPDQDIEGAMRAVLSADELDRADRFIRQEHRLRFATGRGVLRHVLAGCSQSDAKDIRFEYGAHGKPSLSEPKLPIEFNVSNTGTVGVIAITLNRPIGVDVEHYREKFDIHRLAKRFFSPNEIRDLFGLSPDEQVRAFYRCWSSKEAFMKVCGRGMSLGLNRFDVEVDPAIPPRVCRVPDDLGSIEQWEMRSLPIEGDMAGILAVEGRIDAVHHFVLDPKMFL